MNADILVWLYPALQNDREEGSYCKKIMVHGHCDSLAELGQLKNQPYVSFYLTLRGFILWKHRKRKRRLRLRFQIWSHHIVNCT